MRLGSCSIVLATALLAAPLLAPAAADAPPPVAYGLPARDLAASLADDVPLAYASVWAGDWVVDSGWGGVERALRDAKNAGVTPVVFWYYWGDSISPTCVQNGCNGRTRAEWNALNDQLASRLDAVLDGHPALVVMENEFNKGGITGTYAGTFDTLLAENIQDLQDVDGVDVVLGFGGWGEDKWARFPKSLDASDYVGFQAMRASTRDTESAYRGVADRVATLAAKARDVGDGKPSFLYDLALSSYGGARWVAVQEETLADVLARGDAYAALGLRGVVYRSLNDHHMSPANYYGYAESHWGLRTKDGDAKPAYDAWRDGVRASAAAPTAVTFRPYDGNAWWVQAKVESDASVKSVCARVNDGACQPLTLRWWGAWAASHHAPAGSRVVFEATLGDGQRVASGAYAWPVA